MSADAHFTLLLTAIGVVGLPTLALLFRMTVQWTRTQDRLADIADDLTRLEKQGQADRRVMNERVTWLERNVWARSHRE